MARSIEQQLMAQTSSATNATTTTDPDWGLIDPAAGHWFPEMALQLAANADPELGP